MRFLYVLPFLLLGACVSQPEATSAKSTTYNPPPTWIGEISLYSDDSDRDECTVNAVYWADGQLTKDDPHDEPTLKLTYRSWAPLGLAPELRYVDENGKQVDSVVSIELGHGKMGGMYEFYRVTWPRGKEPGNRTPLQLTVAEHFESEVVGREVALRAE